MNTSKNSAYTYQIVPSGPAVPAEECERAAASIEIVIRWGESVLHVAHLTPPRAFSVGEARGKEAPADVFLPAEKLGATRIPLVVMGQDGRALLVIPAHAGGTVTCAGEAATSIGDAIESGKLERSSALAGAHQIALASGVAAEIDLDGIRVAVSSVNAGRAPRRPLGVDTRSLPYQGLSLLLHAGVLAATALFMPHLAMAGEDEGISEEQRTLLAAKLSAIAEREPAEALVKDPAAGDPSAPSASDARAIDRALSARPGPRDPGTLPAPTPGAPMSREEAMRDAGRFGMNELVRSLEGNVPVAASPWSTDDARASLLAGSVNMWSQNLDEIGGNTLALSGVGEIGGQPFQGINVGGIRTIGSTGGDPLAVGDRARHSRVRGEHKAAAPVVRVGETSVVGPLAPELIQRVVRQNFGRFRLCYENGLRQNPALAGRVTVRFAVGRDGAVVSAASGGSDLPDSSVVSCVTRAFYGLSFPPPGAGVVKVTYPIVFSPAN